MNSIKKLYLVLLAGSFVLIPIKASESAQQNKPSTTQTNLFTLQNACIIVGLCILLLRILHIGITKKSKSHRASEQNDDDNEADRKGANLKGKDKVCSICATQVDDREQLLPLHHHSSDTPKKHWHKGCTDCILRKRKSKEKCPLCSTQVDFKKLAQKPAQCCICLETKELDVIHTPANNIPHRACLGCIKDLKTNRKTTCPLCRTDVNYTTLVQSLLNAQNNANNNAAAADGFFHAVAR